MNDHHHLINNILGRPEWAATTQQDLIAAKAIRPDLFTTTSSQQQQKPADNRPLWGLIRKGALLGAAQAIQTKNWALKRQLLEMADEAATKSGADALLLAAVMEMGPVPAPDISNRLIAGLLDLAKSATDADLKAALAVIAREKAGQEARQQADRARQQAARVQNAARRQDASNRRFADKRAVEEAATAERNRQATESCPFVGQRVRVRGCGGYGYVVDVPGAEGQRAKVPGAGCSIKYFTGVVASVEMELKESRYPRQGYVPVYVITDLIPV